MGRSPGGDPYAATAELLEPQGRYAISDSAWAMHVLGLQRALPDSGYVSMTAALPMLRAIKDADELERLADHVHGPDCGHEPVPHGDHVDYLVAGHLHHPHGDHCDDHGPVEVVGQD